jgi:hypothetical protein
MLTSFLTTTYEMHLRAKKLILNKNDDQSLFEKKRTRDDQTFWNIYET